MIKNKAIKLGRGLDNLPFGSSKDDVEQLLGEPNEIDSFENDSPEQGESHIWHYDDHGFSLTFDEADGFRLGLISVNRDNYLLRDLIRVGMNKQAVLDALEELAMPDYAEEDHSNLDNPDHTLVAIDDKSLYLWFDGDDLTEIQWFPYYNEEEEIIWPS